jgi:rod shape-determining protein MreD
MVKKYGFIFFLSIIISILQQAIFSRIVILNYTFDSVFVFLICFALLNNEIDSLLLALLCGLIRDSFFPYVFGINTILYILCVYLITQINKRVYRDAIMIPISLTFVFSILKGGLFFGYLFIASFRFNLANKIINGVFLEAIFNSIACIIIYKIAKKVKNLQLMKQEWKF